MRTSTIMLTALVAVLLVASFAVAEEAASAAVSNDLSGDAGTTPDSAMYGLKLGWEKMGLWFTFNQEKKAQKELKLAGKRLLEAKVMAEKGNEKGFARAQEAHDAFVARAQARLEAIDEDGKEDKIKDSTKKISGLEVAIENHENKIDILKEKLAEGNLSEEQKASIEALIDKMEAKTEAMKQKLEERRDKIKTRLQAVSEKTKAEVESEVEEIDNETGLIEVKKVIAERRIERAENAVARVETKLATVEAKGTDVSAAEAKITEYKADIAAAQSAFDAGDYDKALAEIKPVSNYGRQRSAIAKIIAEVRQDIRAEAGDAGAKVKVKAGADSASANVDAGGVHVVAGAGQVIALD